MTTGWDPAGDGVLRLPSGRLLRGRGLRLPPPSGPEPTFGVYLLGHPPPRVPWETRWIRWPDLWLPRDRARTAEVLCEAWQRATTDRVEIACAAGIGRTGTALACIAIIDGVPASQAISFVRRAYYPYAVETPWQRRYVAKFASPRGPRT